MSLSGPSPAAVWGCCSNEDVWPSKGQCKPSHLSSKQEVLWKVKSEEPSDLETTGASGRGTALPSCHQ